MTREEFKIGEEIQFGLVKLKCVEGEHKIGVVVCNDNCFFRSYGRNYCHLLCRGYCDKSQRSDKKDVIFIETKE